MRGKIAVFARGCMSNRSRRPSDRSGESNATRRKAPLSSSESGAVAVEFAIVLPVFLLFLFGIIEFGSLFFLQNNMVNAAREAARSWSVQSPQMTSTQAGQVALTYLTTAGFGQTFTVTATDGCTLNPKVQDIIIHIDTNAAAASLVNYTGLFTGRTLKADVRMRKEFLCP